MSEIRTVTCAKCHRPLMLIDFYGQQLVPSDLRLGQDVLFPLILWFLLTRQNCKVPVAANSQDQLRDTIWPEIGKWHRQLPLSTRFMYAIRPWRSVR